MSLLASGCGALLVSAALAARGAPPDPWGGGECLEFEISYYGIVVGTASIEIHPPDAEGSKHPGYRIEAAAETSPLFSRVFHVEDHVVSWMDPLTLDSRRLELHLHEGPLAWWEIDHFGGSATSVVVDRFDWNQQGDHFELPVPPRTEDPLSALYYVRAQDLPLGGVVTCPVYASEKVWELRVSPIRRERIETPVGPFSTIVVTPETRFEGRFQTRGRVEAWLTDDPRHLLVAFKSKVALGSIDGILIKMELPDGTIRERPRPAAPPRVVDPSSKVF